MLRRILLGVSILTLSATLIGSTLISHQDNTQAQPAPTERPLFAQRFVGDGDISQCDGAAYGEFVTSINEWTPEVRIDTDGRAGGCLQSFALLDTEEILSGLSLSVDFQPDGDLDQCGNPGLRVIPTNISRQNITYSDPYRIDTDDRGGGCQQTFSLSGRDDIVLDIRFTPDGDSEQCGNAGTFTVTQSTPVTFRFDTDKRAGGCRQSFRLRSI